MKLFFNTRDRAREFAAKRDHYKFVDMGEDADNGRRWAVDFSRVVGVQC